MKLKDEVALGEEVEALRGVVKSLALQLACVAALVPEQYQHVKDTSRKLTDAALELVKE